MTVGTVISAEVINYNKLVDGVEVKKTMVTYDVIGADKAITSFITNGSEMKHSVGDNVFLVVNNQGYTRGYKQDAISKENVAKTKEFKNSWDDMWK